MQRRTLLTSLLGSVPVGLSGCTGFSQEEPSQEEQFETPEDTDHHDQATTEPDTEGIDSPGESQSETSTEGESTGTTPPSERVVIRDHEMTQRNVHGSRENIVTGTAENVSEYHVNSALIHVYFLDGNGELVQRFGHMCNDIPPNGLCEFDVNYSGSFGRPFDVESYEVEVAVVT